MIILLDRTGSMQLTTRASGNTRCTDALNRAKADVRAFLEDQPGGRAVAIWIFARSPGPDRTRIVDLAGGFVDEWTALKALSTLDLEICEWGTPLAQLICQMADVFPQGLGPPDKILAISSEKRINIWPDVPTMKESGVDLEFDQWRGIAAPKGTPQAVVVKLSPLVKKAVESKEWVEFASSLGSTPRYLAPAAFAKFIAGVDKETREIMEDAGLLK
jgi:hypothetical protein